MELGKTVSPWTMPIFYHNLNDGQSITFVMSFPFYNFPLFSWREREMRKDINVVVTL